MEKVKNVSVKSNSHNRDINQNRLKCNLEGDKIVSISGKHLSRYRLFVRSTVRSFDVNIREHSLTRDSFPATLYSILKQIYDDLCTRPTSIKNIRVAFSRFFFARYLKSESWLEKFLSNLFYLNKSYHLDDDEFVCASVIPLDGYLILRYDYIIKKVD